jgi:putative CocE/NonD family hydrolase
LAEPTTLLGPFSAKLWVSTSGEDTDFIVEILRLTPKGELRGIMAGIQRLRYRTGKDEPVRPKETVEVEIDCWASGLRFDAGDRLRVQVSSNAFPGYARNLNTLEPIATAKTPKVVQNKVIHDMERPSHLRVPVVGGKLTFSP